MSEEISSHLNPTTMSVILAANEMDSTLLITGNTGTGKSHLAYSIHRASRRAGGKWYKVNLATLSENLIESELFGHERGAFTGADVRRVGRLEACDGGTVFLDEIGELPPRLQAKLLDFIQYKKISPVGSNREIELDARIIVATNRNLEASVRSGEFRADLYHRLNVFQVKLPDLALSPRAIAHFARSFAEELAQKTGKPSIGLSREVESAFRQYNWPGNIRELQNAMEYAFAMEKTDVIQLSSLPGPLQSLKATATDTPIDEVAVTKVKHANAVGYLELPMTLDYHETKNVFEKVYLEQALRLCSGQINLTSRRIGLNKVSLSEKIRKYAIDWRKIRYECLGPSLSSNAATT